MNKITESNIEKFAWNRRYVEEASDPSSNIFSKRLLRRLNKKDILGGLTTIYNFEGKKILDLGVGDGKYTLPLAQRCAVKRIIAIDFSEEGIRLAEKKRRQLGLKDCTFIVADIQHLPFKNNSFDVVNLINVLHHVLVPRKVLQEVYRLADTCILFEKNRLNPYEWYTVSRRRIKYLSEPSFFIWELKRLIKGAGFKIEKINYYQFVTYSIYNLRILKKFFWRGAFIKISLYLSHFLQKVPGVRCFSYNVMIRAKRRN